MIRGLAKMFGAFGDAGASAAGSFVIGLVALQTLRTDELALYALVFSAGVAAMVIPQQMAYLPRRLHLNRALLRVRSRYGSDLISALPYALGAAGLTVLAGGPLYGTVRIDVAIAISSGAALWVVCSSFQDHIRTALHVSSDHNLAAAVSFTSLGVSLVVFLGSGVFEGDTSPIANAVVPFAALCSSNILSAALGVFLHREVEKVAPGGAATPSLGLKVAASSFILQCGSYSANLLTALILGGAALATLETARVAAQPVLVAGAAFSAIFVPTAIRLQQAGESRAAKRRIRKMIVVVLGTGGAYALVLPLLVEPLGAIAGRGIDGALAVARALAFSLQSTIGPVNQLRLAAHSYLTPIVSTGLGVLSGLLALPALLESFDVLALPIFAAVVTLSWALATQLISRRRRK